jgi:hypothetical protein
LQDDAACERHFRDALSIFKSDADVRLGTTISTTPWLSA